jgi:hypothetical protein
MKHVLLILLAAVVAVANVQAQSRIYRCGNVYTNTITEAQKGSCQLLEGGNVTVVQGQRPPVAPAPARVANTGPAAPRGDGIDQRSRDSDTRLILESELKRAEARRDELLREYNNGEPDKLGPETRNHQKYLDRVAELKLGLDRLESDIGGIRREIARLPVSK